jgi:hypothetical protein
MSSTEEATFTALAGLDTLGRVLLGLSLFSSRKVNSKNSTLSVTLNLAAHAWSTKCRRKKN